VGAQYVYLQGVQSGGYTDSNADTGSYANSNGYARADRDSNTHAHGNSYSSATNSDSDTNCDPCAHRNTDCDSDTNSDADGDTNTNTNSFSNSDAHSGRRDSKYYSEWRNFFPTGRCAPFLQHLRRDDLLHNRRQHSNDQFHRLRVAVHFIRSRNQDGEGFRGQSRLQQQRRYQRGIHD
jgi:hypothetical protein